MDTDAGQGFIKGLGNPQGPTALVSELIAAELGTWLGLQVPPFAVVHRCDIEIPMLDHHAYIQPPVFFSQAVDGVPHDGSDTFLRHLRRPADVARLVIFDTWVWNSDRYDGGGMNLENLLYRVAATKRQYDLIPIDHSHCFVDMDFETDLPDASLVADDTIYGLFPEFRPLITMDAVSAAVARLQTLEREFVVRCVNSVPAEWRLGREVRGHLVELICERAVMLAASVADRLVDDPTLPGIVRT